jgi:glutaredoxin 3
MVTVYTMKYCPYCVRAKELLSLRGVPFTEKMLIEDDDPLWDDLYKLSGMKTMPQIFFQNKCIGGYTQLAELDRKDGLQSLILSKS